MTETFDDSPSIKAAVEHAKSVGELEPLAQPEPPADQPPADASTSDQTAA